ncbi:MAG: nucleoside monophosphate kinase [Candidatus Paceibacterota bacterium]|jgi:adenylate kinase family enzyme
MHSFIFIGRSGCGKGTQVELLGEYLKKQNPETEVFHLESGAEFREFIKGDTTTQKISKQIYDDGGLQPEFLSVYMWAKILSTKFKNTEHLLIDGTPRRLHEAGALHSIFGFYKRVKPYVIYINVSRKWAEDRLLARKRIDDNADDIKARLDWFESEVMPVVKYYQSHQDYNFLDINGEQTIADVQAEIVNRLDLKV